MQDAPIRVLHVIDADGDGLTLVRQLAERAPAGIEAHLLLLDDPEPEGPLDGVEEPERADQPDVVDELPARDEPFFASTVRLPGIGPWWRPGRLARSVSAAIEAIGPDVVHAHSVRADLALTYGRRRPAAIQVATRHASSRVDADPWTLRLQTRVAGLLSGRFDAVVVDGEQARASLRSAGYSATRTRTIPVGVPIVDDPLLGPRPRRLLTLSPWRPSSDYPTLLAAFREVRRLFPDVRLACAGEGVSEATAELRDLLEAAGLRTSVELLGEVEEVTDELEGSIALVLSRASGDTLPTAGLEAIASGTPVVTTDVGSGSRLAVKDFQVVPPRDPKALAGALRHLLTLPDAEYDRLVLLSHQHARDEFDVDSTVAAYGDLYRDLLGR